MPTEIERKFLLAEVPDCAVRGRPDRILQGYLAVTGDGTEVRVRKCGRGPSLTVKRGKGLVREETEVALTDEQFDALWRIARSARIRKSRFVVTVDGLAVEIDRYEGRLSGLVIAEIEFASVEQARAFNPPAWFGPEVTGDVSYANAQLSRAPAPPSAASSTLPPGTRQSASPL